jgi:hypothetical protein
VTEEIGGTTRSFAEGKRLSDELRATRPEEMQALVQELQRVSQTARDYVVPAPALHFQPRAEGLQCMFSVLSGSTLEANLECGVARVAHEQLSEKLQIPMPYYGRMQSTAPDLLAENLNYWLARSQSNLLLRTLDGRVRAVLSDRYRTLDNQDVFFHVGKVAVEVGAVVQRLEISDERFYMRLLLPEYGAKITGRADELKAKGLFFSRGYRRDDGTWQGPDGDEGDWVFPGVITSNSEVGRGGLNVEAAVFRVTCVNYIIAAKTLHRVHLGERREGGFQIASDTQEAKDRAIWLEVRDLVRATFDPAQFAEMVAALNEAQATVLQEPAEAVDVVVKEYGLSEDDKQAVLNGLLSGGTGPTVWGLLNAVTVLAHGKGVEAGVSLERVGADMLQRLPELVKVRRATS